MGRRMAEDMSTFISIRSDDCDLLTIIQARSEVGFDTVNYRSNCSLGRPDPIDFARSSAVAPCASSREEPSGSVTESVDIDPEVYEPDTRATRDHLSIRSIPSRAAAAVAVCTFAHGRINLGAA